jgi:hypothetical protein
MAKPGRKKRENPPTEEELARRKARYNEARNRKRREQTAVQQRERQEWREIGWIVRKMNREAGLSQEKIWELLGGLVIRKKIKKWCAPDYEPW